MASIADVCLPALLKLDIENAGMLSDVSAIAGFPALQMLRLNSIAKATDLSMLSRISTLRMLQVGGRNAPPIDWFSLMQLPFLQRIFAWWDPEDFDEDSLRNEAKVFGREILKFEPVPGQGRRPLLVDLM